MLNPFPELLNYALLAPFLLRALLGLIFLDLGILKLRGERSRWITSFETLHLNPADLLVGFYALLQIAGAALLFLGLYTQVAALFFALSTGAELFVETRAQSVLKRDYTFYLILFVISLSLLLTGAGAFAFDIPL